MAQTDRKLIDDFLGYGHGLFVFVEFLKTPYIKIQYVYRMWYPNIHRKFRCLTVDWHPVIKIYPCKISYIIFNIMLIEKINFSFAGLICRTLILWMDMDGKTALSLHGITKN